MSMVDYAALPPEVNSARMYSGSGAGPLVTAASAWDGLAAELNATARSYQSVISELTGAQWLGPSSTAAGAAATPYLAWMDTTAAQAEQTANQARAAAAAYEAAFAATVPPPLISANRALLSVLLVTNTFGQNASQIAATEAQYAEYWAQDTVAMYNYASNSAAATMLTSFSTPQQNTNSAAAATQSTAVSQATNSASSVSSALQQLSSGASSNPANWLNNLSTWLQGVFNSYPVQTYENFNYNLTSGYQFFTEGTTFLACGLGLTAAPPIMTAMSHGIAAAPALATGGLPEALPAMEFDAVTPIGDSALSAGLGEATTVGSLSVPPSWASSAPAMTSPGIRLASAEMPMSSLEALPAAAGGGGMFNGVPILGNVVNASRGGGADSRSGKKVRLDLGHKGGKDDVPNWSTTPGKHEITGRYSERDELNELRKVAADLAKERDVLKRSANMLITEAINR